MTQTELVLEITRRKSNYTKVLEYLQKHGEATNVELTHVGGYRYSARIKELRDDGYKIMPVRGKKGLWRFIYLGHKDDKG